MPERFRGQGAFNSGSENLISHFNARILAAGAANGVVCSWTGAKPRYDVTRKRNGEDKSISAGY